MRLLYRFDFRQALSSWRSQPHTYRIACSADEQKIKEQILGRLRERFQAEGQGRFRDDGITNFALILDESFGVYSPRRK